jgi:hypothetical protein
MSYQERWESARRIYIARRDVYYSSCEPEDLGRVLINQSGETHGAHVRFAPNSDAKADILGPPLRALGDVETT